MFLKKKIKINQYTTVPLQKRGQKEYISVIINNSISRSWKGNHPSPQAALELFTKPHDHSHLLFQWSEKN